MNYQDSLSLLAVKDSLSIDESFSLAKLVSKLLIDKSLSHLGRDLVIRVLDIWRKIPLETHSMWFDLVESAGYYPYLSGVDITGAALLRRESHRSKYLTNETYFHSEQLRLSLLLESLNSLIVSAPTSFGKSKLIEEIVASERYSNIVIIQPTLALLDETRKKLSKYSEIYNIVVTTTQKPKDGNNLFLFTGERVAEYDYFPLINFFVIDEFYKLSLDRDDERASSLNHALYKLLKMTSKFYMLGPSIKSIPEGFARKHDAVWYKTDYATVAVDIEHIAEGKRISAKDKEPTLFKLLTSFNEPTIIYCSSPSKANTLIRNFLNYILLSDRLKNELKTNASDEVISWIKEYIHADWTLGKALAYSTASHHGALPRHISSSIIDLFNIGSIRYLFCTSTLIEGVNTSAKNVVLFDKTKGTKPIDYFDFKNITGRSGRMKQHFIGKVYKFYEDPKQEELDIDIPLHTQDNAPLELLVQLDNSELSESAAGKLSQFNELRPDIQSLIKNNKGMSVEGQLNILGFLDRKIDRYYRLIAWSGAHVNHEQLSFIIKLAWENFKNNSNRREQGVSSPKHLAALTLTYLHAKTIRGMIESIIDSDFWINKFPKINERVEYAVNQTLQVNQHWFRYKLPKWLSVVSELQKYICLKHNLMPGDYTVLANLIETSFLPTHLAILLDYGIPSSAIKKIGKYVTEKLEPQELIQRIKSMNTEQVGFLSYEIRKIREL